MKTTMILAAAGCLLATLATAQPVAPRYTITDLGTLRGGTFSQASYIQNNGLVTGVSTAPDGTQHSVIWYGGFVGDFGATSLGGPNSEVFGINAKGQADGQAETSKTDPNGEDFCGYGSHLICLPFLWRGGVTTALPTLGGNNGTVGTVNSSGEVSGIAENSTRDAACSSPQVLDYEAVVWGPGPGQIRQLRPLPGDTVSEALWINDNGQAVGASGTCANSALPPLAYGSHAVIWQKDGSVQDLGNLGASAANVALSINNLGQVVGASSLTQNPPPLSTHGFLWTSTTGMRDLGTLPGDVASGAVGINNTGQVVGLSQDSSANPRACLWENGVITDLNTIVSNSPLSLLIASAINAAEKLQASA